MRTSSLHLLLLASTGALLLLAAPASATRSLHQEVPTATSAATELPTENLATSSVVPTVKSSTSGEVYVYVFADLKEGSNCTEALSKKAMSNRVKNSFTNWWKDQFKVNVVAPTTTVTVSCTADGKSIEVEVVVQLPVPVFVRTIVQATIDGITSVYVSYDVFKKNKNISGLVRYMKTNGYEITNIRLGKP